MASTLFHTIIISSVLSVLLLSRAVEASSDEPHTSVNVEAQALMAFRKGITNDPSGLLASWDVAAGAGADPCTWSGIACDAQKQHVTRVNLAGLNLSGSISPSLALLPALSHLNLSFNLLSGALPESLANMSALLALDLSSNSFVGAIPPSLGECKRLQRLYLEETGLTGRIPPEIWQLPALIALNIIGQDSGPLLEAVLPEKIASCPTIRSLFISNVDVAGSPFPSSVGDCQQLRVLILDVTGMTGMIPADVWQLPALMHLAIIAGEESGPLLATVLPNKFASCPTIRSLILVGNVDAAGSPFPSSLGDCQQLRALVLDVIGLQGFIPPETWQLPLLEILVVQDRQVANSIDNSWSNSGTASPFTLHGSMPSSLRCCQTILELTFDGVNLTGELPLSLGQCTALQAIDLSHTSLQGIIPHSFGNLSDLQILHLESNELSGTIPESLSQCSGLESLRLGDNRNLSGVIPRELGKLEHLQVLSLFTTAIFGPMPEEICNCTEMVWLDVGWPVAPGGIGNVPNCIAKQTQLQTLAWQVNFINGEVPMKMLRNLTQLQYLDMSFTTLVGSIPPELGNLSSLHTLGFRGNNLIGPIPRALGQLSSLQRLDLVDNLLNGTLSEEFILDLANGSSITQLFLSQNKLQGVIPSSLGGLQKLTILYLSSNQMVGRIPSTLGNCTSLQDLSLANNRLEGVIPATLGQLSGLDKGLMLSGNQLLGEIPNELGALAQLQVLDLSRNKLIGHVPKSLENCSNLQTLRLFQNNLNGRIEHFDLSRLQQLTTFTVHHNNFIGGLPSGFATSKNLVLFDVQENNLSGTLPSSTRMHALLKLRVLALSTNKLRGEIPEWVWKLPMLQVLDLSNNYFHGTMPATVTHLDYFKQDQSHNASQTTLYEEVPQTVKFTFQVLTYVLNTRIFLDVSMNYLKGEIAESFGELLGLTGLNLSHNYIVGKIPTSLGKLINLDVLDLSHNNLTGGIPQELGQVGGLSTVDLSYNHLQGPIPKTNNFNTRHDYTSFEGNPGLCGAPLSINCSKLPIINAVSKHVDQSHAWSFTEWIDSFASPWALLISYPLGFLGGIYIFNHFCHS